MIQGKETDPNSWKLMKSLLWNSFSYIGQAGGGVDREVFLNVKHGVEAKSYEDVSLYWKSWLDVKLLDTG